MPRAYSLDLRERALAAYEAGRGSQAEIAERFQIGERTLSGWLRTAREEDRRAPKPRAGGRVAVGGQAAVLAELVDERNDATLSEYAGRLAERTGVRRSLAAVCRALKRLGLVRKTRRSGPPSRSVRMWPQQGSRGAPISPGSTRTGWSSSTRAGSTPAWPGPTRAPIAGIGPWARSLGADGSG